MTVPVPHGSIEVLLPEQLVQTRVTELADEISEDFRGKELALISVLKGSVLFLADLMRRLSVPSTVDFIAISNYGADTSTPGVVRIVKDLEDSIEGKNVLIVEDIIDTGLTLNYLLQSLKPRQPASIGICTLLDRPSRRLADIPLKYVGFDLPDYYVVGYGLDYKSHYRNLPFIGVLDVDDIKWGTGGPVVG